MNSGRNLKLPQLRKLFIRFKSRITRSLNIFETREGFCLEFQSLEEMEIWLDKGLDGSGPLVCPLLVSTARQRC
jgi:hypothetical protein